MRESFSGSLMMAGEEAEIDRLPIDLLSHIFVLITSFTDLAQYVFFLLLFSNLAFFELFLVVADVGFARFVFVEIPERALCVGNGGKG